mgnify:FL=1
MNQYDEALKKETAFLGQPRGVGTLSFVQLCSSFSSYAMNAVMIYYLYANAPAGLGFDKADAAQLISLYATVVGMTTIIGSYVCDRILGCRRSLLVARVTGFIGYTLLAFPLGVVGYAAAMGCMVFSSLFAGRCIETLIGKFYDENDGRRDSAFTISYVISNIGAAAPALAGVIAAKSGYHAAFALSAVLSFLGTVAYIATYKKFFGNIGLEPDEPGQPGNTVTEKTETAVTDEPSGVAVEEAVMPQKRVSSKQRKLSLEEYRTTYLQVPKIVNRKPVFVSETVRDELDRVVRYLGGKGMSASGLIENLVRLHLDAYRDDIEQWRKL